MSLKSTISNMMNSFSKYGKGVKSTVNKYSMPRMTFINTLLHSQYLLYFIVFITFLIMCTYAITGDYVTIILFAIIAFLTSFFNKNMIVVFSVALIISIVLGNTTMIKNKVAQYQNNMEGFDGKVNDDDEEENNAKSDEDSDMKKKKPDMKKKEPTSDTDEKTKDLQLLKKDYDEFKGIQDKIMEGIQDINKELTKAEAFVDKYQQYKKKHSE